MQAVHNRLPGIGCKKFTSQLRTYAAFVGSSSGALQQGMLSIVVVHVLQQLVAPLLLCTSWVKYAQLVDQS
jgi:hypothetical protein